MSTAIVAMPKATALSTDVGIQALNYLSALATDEQMIDELRDGMESNRGKAQVLLRWRATRPAWADKSINSDARRDRQQVAEGNFRQPNPSGNWPYEFDRWSEASLTPEANAVLNAMPGDDARALKRKKSIRANFSTMLTKSMRVALHAIESNLS